MRDFPPVDQQTEAVTSQTVFFTDAEFKGRPVRVSRANYLAFLSMKGSEVQGGEEVARTACCASDHGA